MAVKAIEAITRAVDAADAEALLRLHRELWFDHDARGGMPASRSEETWDAYGQVLERQLEHRDGRLAPLGAFEGKLGHLVVEFNGSVVGQVEVYLDRFGHQPATPYVGELRSLIVAQEARGFGFGTALVREIAALASARARVLRASARRSGSLPADSPSERPTPQLTPRLTRHMRSDAVSRAAQRSAVADPLTLITAEVLARNDALTFYDALGFRTIERLVAIAGSAERPSGIHVSTAHPMDAQELTIIDHGSRQRRYAWGDPRFDPPIDPPGPELARFVAEGIAFDDAQRGTEPGRLREEIIARNDHGTMLGAAYLVSSPLGPPFAAVNRAEIARVAVDPSRSSAFDTVRALVAEALERSRLVGAPELLVRSPFRDPIGEQLTTLRGCRPFSWILAASAQTILESASNRE